MAADDVELVVHGPGDDPGERACATVELADALERRVFADPARWTIGDERVAEGDTLCIAVDPTAPPITATVAYGPFPEEVELPGGAPVP